MVVYFTLMRVFPHQPMVFHWSLRDSKSPQVSRTLLSILADLNNAVVWMVFTHPLISNSPSPGVNPLAIAPRVPITICITVTFMFHIFFSHFPGKVKELFFLFVFFQFHFARTARTAKSTIRQVHHFF